MVEIKILLFRPVMLHFPRHISAVIYDLETEESFTVCYPFPKNGRTIENDDRKNFYGSVKNSCCVGVITLYSHKSLKKFKQLYGANFNDGQDFDLLKYNCSDAVNFTLDHFFPDQDFVDSCQAYYRALCGCGSLITLGLACFPTFCKNSPTNIFDKALMLSWSYGEITEEMTAVNDIKRENYGTLTMAREEVEEQAIVPQYRTNSADLVDKCEPYFRLC